MVIRRAQTGAVAGQRTGMAARHVGTVAVATVALLLFTGIPGLTAALPMEQTTATLGLATVALGGMSVMLGAVIGRLTGDRRATWIGLALALYSFVAVPANIVGSTVARGDAVVGNVRFFAHLSVVLALLCAGCLPGVRRRCSCRSAFAVAVLVLAAVATLGVLVPEASLAVSGYAPVRLAIVAGGVVAGLVLAATGWAKDSSSLSWTGLGATVIALAHVERVDAGLPSLPLGFGFSVVRLFGMALVVFGLARLALHGLRALDQSQSMQQEELRLAKVDLRRAAEQDHELRNGLAGLAGAAGLLVVRPEECAHLRAAMTSELARLDDLLRPSPGCSAAVGQKYSVASVLRQQVALGVCAGMDVRLDADSQLCTEGSPATLAQVLTNLFANCRAHAPGSPVEVWAGRRSGVVAIEISDSGPGVPKGGEQMALQAGVRGADSGGQGLGLHISQRLLQVEGGTIRIEPRQRERPGCTVVVELPANSPVRSGPRPVALSGQL